MIVVDASILVSAAIDTEDNSWTKRVAAKDPNWIFPPLWCYELTNALVTLVRAREVSMEELDEALYRGRLLASTREIAVDQSIATRLAIKLGISGYDAQYVALADAFGVKCVSADRTLAHRAANRVLLPETFLA